MSKRLRYGLALARVVAWGLALPALQYGLFRLFLEFRGVRIPADRVGYASLGLLVAPLLLGLFLVGPRLRGVMQYQNLTRIWVWIAVGAGCLSGILLGNLCSRIVNSLFLNDSSLQVLGETRLHPMEFSFPSMSDSLFPWFVIVFVPILEEIWYRELTLTRALKVLSPFSAVTLTALLFAMAHMFSSPDVHHYLALASGIFPTGLVLGLLRARYGLAAAMLGHSLQNALGLYVGTFPFP
ncbi:CPBP family intramembrane glutamic endopeptidase [Oligoflexus tunisiensis]|uniref:CPBP family intramembrane glutamic endopeptidase n=1 Tax=Oligoflexus tunisiensis TaxID=708132 RepID=UPI00114CCAFB|nr:CPBP family intramembrane glutamic endopeptidase [Oligoflexus tunisiensis]